VALQHRAPFGRGRIRSASNVSPAPRRPTIDDQPAPTVGSSGEFGVIRAVAALTGSTPGVLIGPGDDAAVVAAPDGRVVVTTDALVEGVHFRRDWSSAYDVGRKAAAQNLADIVAMGARPTALVVAFAAPPELALAWAEDLMRGLVAEAAAVGAAVVGGDVVRAPQIVVTVTALGDLEGRAPLTRSGARPGDILVLAGATGLSAAGMVAVASGDADATADLAAVAAAHRSPSPPYAAALALAALGATAMIDTSDGLSSELHHLAAASVVGIRVDDVPIDARLAAVAQVLTGEPLRWALHGGEDHAFLATLPPGAAGRMGDIAVRIGVVTDDGVVTYRGEPLIARGWDHFGGAT
jgi:thiamine-monophosphate kinase